MGASLYYPSEDTEDTIYEPESGFSHEPDRDGPQILDLQPLELWEINFSDSTHSLWYFVTAAWMD